MKDYQPLDLSEFCNAGLEVFEQNSTGPGNVKSNPYESEHATIPIGFQHLRGLPFIIGSTEARNSDRLFIAFDHTTGNVTIPINQRVRRIIMAHCLLESNLMEGGSLGNPIADYVFHGTDDGSEVGAHPRKI